MHRTCTYIQHRKTRSLNARAPLDCVYVHAARERVCRSASTLMLMPARPSSSPPSHIPQAPSGHSLVYSWSWGDVPPSPCPAGWQGRDSPRRESNARAEAGSAHNRDTAISRRLVPADKWNKMRRTRLLGSAALPPHLLSSLLPLTCHLNDSDDRDASR